MLYQSTLGMLGGIDAEAQGGVQRHCTCLAKTVGLDSQDDRLVLVARLEAKDPRRFVRLD